MGVRWSEVGGGSPLSSAGLSSAGFRTSGVDGSRSEDGSTLSQIYRMYESCSGVRLTPKHSGDNVDATLLAACSPRRRTARRRRQRHDSERIFRYPPSDDYAIRRVRVIRAHRASNRRASNLLTMIRPHDKVTGSPLNPF